MEDEQHIQNLVQQQVNAAVAAALAAQPPPPLPVVRALPPPAKFSGLRSRVKASDWLYLFEAWVVAQNIPVEQWALAVRLLLDEGALVWHRRLDEREMLPQTWGDYKAAFLAAFEPYNQVQKARDALERLFQRRSVTEYAESFRQLILHVPNMTEEEQIDRFIRHLKPEIELQVSLQRHATLTLEDVIKLAETVDTVIMRNRKVRPTSEPQSTGHRTFHNPSMRREQPQAMELDAITTLSKSSPPPLGSSDKTRLRAENRCFYCKGVGHIAALCPKKMRKEKTYALNCLSRTAGSPLAFNGKIGRCHAHILVDSGAAGNFVSRDFVAKHRLPTIPVDGPEVRLADNSSYTCTARLAIRRLMIGAYIEHNNNNNNYIILLRATSLSSSTLLHLTCKTKL